MSPAAPGCGRLLMSAARRAHRPRRGVLHRGDVDHLGLRQARHGARHRLAAARSTCAACAGQQPAAVAALRHPPGCRRRRRPAGSAASSPFGCCTPSFGGACRFSVRDSDVDGEQHGLLRAGHRCWCRRRRRRAASSRPAACRRRISACRPWSTSPVSTLTRRFMPPMPITRSRSATGLKSTMARPPLSKRSFSWLTCVARPVIGVDRHDLPGIGQAVQLAVGRAHVDAEQPALGAGDAHRRGRRGASRCRCGPGGCRRSGRPAWRRSRRRRRKGGGAGRAAASAKHAGCLRRSGEAGAAPLPALRSPGASGCGAQPSLDHTRSINSPPPRSSRPMNRIGPVGRPVGRAARRLQRDLDQHARLRPDASPGVTVIRPSARDQAERGRRRRPLRQRPELQHPVRRRPAAG